jgi:hypothetical protein
MGEILRLTSCLRYCIIFVNSSSGISRKVAVRNNYAEVNIRVSTCAESKLTSLRTYRPVFNEIVI